MNESNATIGAGLSHSETALMQSSNPFTLFCSPETSIEDYKGIDIHMVYASDSWYSTRRHEFSQNLQCRQLDMTGLNAGGIFGSSKVRFHGIINKRLY